MHEQIVGLVSEKEFFALDGESRLKLFLKTERPDLCVYEIERLSGDASTRQYFRLRGSIDSLVAAVYQEPFDSMTHPFRDVTEIFASAGLPVPNILEVSGDFALMLLEDLGDLRLQDWLDHASAEERRSAYRESVALIISIQAATGIAYEKNSISSSLAFDEAKLMWELNFFYKHFFENYLQMLLPAEREQTLKEELNAIARELSERPRLLCHRDFHSRNLMLHKDKQCIIDHQDARMGPQTYDLASLLRDPYVELDEEIIAELYDYYIDESRKSGIPTESDEEMRNEFELMTVQRIVKAIGTYAYQTAVMKNTAYVEYIPRAIGTATAAAERLGRFPVLRAALEKI